MATNSSLVNKKNQPNEEKKIILLVAFFKWIPRFQNSYILYYLIKRII